MKIVSDMTPTIVTNFHGVEVLQAPHVSKKMINSLNAGIYERHEVEFALEIVKPGDRVLELGTGAGILSSVIAKNCQPKEILTFEANPDLIPHIRALHTYNGLGEIITVRNEILLSQANAPEEVSFHIGQDFLGSGMGEHVKSSKLITVQVPVARAEDVFKSFCPNVMLMDIEGAEIDFIADTDFLGVETLVIEMHRGIYGRDGMKHCRALLDQKGFVRHAEFAKRGVAVYQRP